jgi:uncharacterized protein DUF5317
LLLLITTMIGLGLIIGFLVGGSLKGLKGLHLRVVWVLFVALLIAVLPLFSDTINEHRRLLQLIAFAGVLIFLVVNILTMRGGVRAALIVVGVGWALNFVVIAANGGMPLSRWAFAASGQTDQITIGKGGFYRIVLGGPHTKLYRLGDVIPLKPYREVLSIGDILMILGLALVIAAAMRTVRRGRLAEQPAQ